MKIINLVADEFGINNFCVFAEPYKVMHDLCVRTVEIIQIIVNLDGHGAVHIKFFKFFQNFGILFARPSFTRQSEAGMLPPERKEEHYEKETDIHPGVAHHGGAGAEPLYYGAGGPGPKEREGAAGV